MKLFRLLLLTIFLAIFTSATAYALPSISPEALVSTTAINEWQDDSIEWILNKTVDQTTGEITWTDSTVDSILEVGDRIRGVLEFTGAGDLVNGITTIGGTTDYYEMTATFDLTVKSAADEFGGSSDRVLYEFEATDQAISGFNTAGAVAEFYIDDSGSDGDFDGTADRDDLFTNVTAGTHVLSVGLDNVDDFWFSISDSDDVNVFDTVGNTPGQDGGVGYFALSVLYSNFSFEILETEDVSYSKSFDGALVTKTADADIYGNTFLLNPQGSTGDLRNDTDMFFNAVPEPATFALFGIGLIGLAGFARRKE